MSPHPDIAALIGSRICHDLISPIGAIGNGVELLSMGGQPSGPEMELIAESVENANARIRFFRIAFGAAGADHEVARSEVTSILGAAARGGRLSYVWEPRDEQPRREVRAVFLALQCLETAMPVGGHIHIRKDGPNWHIQGEATRLKIDHGLWDCLVGHPGETSIRPAQVQFLLLPQATADCGRRLTIEIREQDISIRF